MKTTSTVSSIVFLVMAYWPRRAMVLSHCAEWTEWTPWSSDCRCGFPIFDRNRSRGIICGHDSGLNDCWDQCGFNRSHSMQYEPCSEVCKNGGNWNNTECRCSQRYYGKCCEHRVDICEAVAADVVFLLDSSVSQTEEQFKKQLEFVESFVDKVTVNSSAFQIAVLTFSTEVHKEIDFDDRLTKDDIKSKILSIRFRPGATFTDKGLAIARTMLQSRGNRLPGLTIEKFTFVLTDGMSTNRTSTKTEALRLRSLSTVVVVGIGQMVSHEELQRIASTPDNFTMSYVFSVKNFDSLHSLIDRLIDATCGKCSTSSRTDIIALIDDLTTSAMTSTEFSSALNALAYILKRLAAYGKVNGQRFGVLHFDDIENKSLLLSNNLDMNQLLSYVQSIRQYSHTCSLNVCAANMSRNISTAMNEVIIKNFINSDPKARNVLLVLTSGRFDNLDAVMTEVGATTRDTGVNVFAIGAGYDSNIDGLQAIAQEPSNVFMVTEDNLETLDVIQSQLSYIACS